MDCTFVDYTGLVWSPYCDRDSPSNGEYDGVFVADSFLYLRGPWAKEVYIFRMLAGVKKKTGMRCVAVFRGGASFRGGMFMEMLSVVERTLRPPPWMVWIAMGNDLYPPKRDEDRMAQTRDTVYELNDVFSMAQTFCLRHVVVFGGSASMFAYQESFGQELAEEYDRQVAHVQQVLKGMVDKHILVAATTGVEMFRGIETVDRIGHVGHRSLVPVANGLASLSMTAGWGINWSKL